MTNVSQSVVMVKKLFSGFAAVALLLGLATTASAQQSSGSIKGTVDGADSGTMVEVVDLDRGVTKSEAVRNGEFRFDGLNPGQYEVRVISNGSAVDTETVNVRLAGTVTIAMATTAAAIEEIVTTGTRMAAIDTSIAESGLVISADELLELPVQRDLASVALLAPGTTRGDYRFTGTAGGGAGNVAFSGASIAENTSFINGLNTTNFRTGVGFSQVPFEFYETLQVKTGGYSAKYGRSTGGVMNARTKSGSNEWKFGTNVYYETDLDTVPNTFLANNDQDENSDTNIDIYASGPILKDRLFFYALYSDNSLNNDLAEDTGRAYDRSTDEGFIGVKLDGYLTDNHHFEYTFFSDERTVNEDQLSFDGQNRGAAQGQTFYNQGGDNWIATYTGDLTDNFQVSVSYGENEQNRTTSSSASALPVVYEYTDSAGFTPIGDWTSFLIDEGDDMREMTRVDFNWVIGDHDLSFGYDNETNSAVNFTIPSGGVYWLRIPDNDYPPSICPAATCPDGVARRRTYASGGNFETVSDAFYIQDVWQVNDRWTLEMGLRNETFENKNGEGATFVEVSDQWAPRLAAVWDPTGEGRSKVYANYGLYYLPVAANTNIRMAGGETYIHDFYAWDGVSVDGNGVPTNISASTWRQDVFGNGEVPDTRSVTDENLDAMYQSEFILGYSTTLDNGIELGIKGIYRNLETTIEDVAIDAAVIDYYNNGAGTWNAALVGGDPVEDVFTGFHQYVLTNPGNDMTVYIPEMDETITLTADQLNYPEAQRQYGAIEFTAARPFDGKWGLQGSYTWSRNFGNHEGYVKSDNGQDDAGITQNFDQPGLVDASYGNLPNDRRHTVKVWGNYRLDNGLLLGTNVLYQSGRPRSCFGVHPTDGFAAAYGQSSHFCDLDGDGAVEPIKRGSLGTTPDTLTVDVSAQYAMQIAEADVTFTLDIFNIFNSQNATLFSENDDEFFGLVQQYQQPQAVRLSARVAF